jgi:hypothetical protein
MDAPRFDALARSLARRVGRRGLFRAGAAGGIAVGADRALPRHAVAQGSGTVGLPCVSCNCTDSGCDCCIIGITGGGVLRTELGDVNLVLFATQLAEDAAQEAAGFVRWIDPNMEGGLSLESVGPIAYTWPAGEQHLRTVSGIMAINGQDEQPFTLEVFDAGPDLIGQDTARITVGTDQSGDETSGFGYHAAGTLVGGDFQLLNSVAPITPGT